MSVNLNSLNLINRGEKNCNPSSLISWFIGKNTEDHKGGVISQRSDSYLVAELRPEPTSSDNLPIAASNLRPEDGA